MQRIQTQKPWIGQSNRIVFFGGAGVRIGNSGFSQRRRFVQSAVRLSTGNNHQSQHDCHADLVFHQSLGEIFSQL